MTWWQDHPRLPDILGAVFIAAVPASTWSVTALRAARQRRRRSRQRAARLAYQPDACDPIRGRAGETIRMTLLADVHEAGAVERAEAWLNAHRDRLTHLSEQGGCGCCIVDWDMAGPREVVETLPNSLRCDSGWTRGERG